MQAWKRLLLALIAIITADWGDSLLMGNGFCHWLHSHAKSDPDGVHTIGKTVRTNAETLRRVYSLAIDLKRHNVQPGASMPSCLLTASVLRGPGRCKTPSLLNTGRSSSPGMYTIPNSWTEELKSGPESVAERVCSTMTAKP